MILCLEYDKFGGHRPAKYIAKRDATMKDTNYCSMRSRFNPDLKYFATNLDEKSVDEEHILALFKDKEYRAKCFVEL